MPSYIIKPDPHTNYYVVWSTVLDNWTLAGTREELEQEYPEHTSPERFDRADEYGTSANWPNTPPHKQKYGWETTEWTVHNFDGEPMEEDVLTLLPRNSLRQWVETEDPNLLNYTSF